MRKFKCAKCGSRELAYQKYAKCVSHINVENGNCIYEEGQVDENDYLPVEFGYICGKCGLPLRHAGRWLQSEHDLARYLTADPGILAEEERLYEAYAIAMSEEEDTKEERFNMMT